MLCSEGALTLGLLSFCGCLLARAQNLDPREQARLLAQKQREKIKADLASTMGGGKFDLEAGRVANAAAANAANNADARGGDGGAEDLSTE